MILNITEQYRIKTDELNWAIQKVSGCRLNRATGEKESNWKDIGYYQNLHSVIIALHQRMVRLCDAETLAEALDESEKYLALITTALAPTYSIVPTLDYKAIEKSKELKHA